MRTKSIIALVVLLVSPVAAMAQTPVDFEADVLPLFRQHCISCHGPDQQMGGYRLDRRSVALREDFGPVTPTNAAASRLYLRLTGNEFGNPMPPAAALTPEEIGIIRDWIDQGASWPDHLANERDLPPPDPQAVAMTDMLRLGQWAEFMRLVQADPELLNARGPEGSTPFMYAALYGDAPMLERQLELGANPNTRNDGNVTPLIWAATNLDKTRLLVDAGADVNARSDDARTPLFAATARHGAREVVELLIEHGADVNPVNRGPADSTPLLEAARSGDGEVVQLLLESGAATHMVGGQALGAALLTGCSSCADLLLAQGLDPRAFTEALFVIAPNGDADAVGLLLEHGARVDATDPFGRTPLMYAVASDLLSLDVVRLLVERGSDVNAISERGAETPLGIARLRGDTPIVDFLVAAGASAEPADIPEFPSQPENTVEAAIRRTIPVLQTADVSFTERTGCISCHNNSLPAMAVSMARSGGFAVDEERANRQVQENAKILSAIREKFRQGMSFADLADPAIFGYVLVGLHGEGYEPDFNTDTVAMNIRQHQRPDGSWPLGASSARPPLGNGTIGQTALALRALQLYAPNVDTDAYEASIERAAAWLAGAEPRNPGDLAWQLLGLAWADRDRDAIDRAVRTTLDAQRADGGWSDLETLSSSAFATGQTLVALRTAGLPISDPAYQRGVRYLLDTQLEDGSWFVQTRALGFQPYFDNGFPHGLSQWISGAATSWATMALSLTSNPADGEE